MSCADAALTAELGELRKRIVEKDAHIEALGKRCAAKARRVIELEAELLQAKDDLVLEQCGERCLSYSTCKDQDCKDARERERKAIDRRVDIGKRVEAGPPKGWGA